MRIVLEGRFFVTPDGLSGALFGTDNQDIYEVLQYRLAYQIRYKLARGVQGEGADAILKQEWDAINQFPGVLSNNLLQKLLTKSDLDQIGIVLGDLPLWEVIVGQDLLLRRFGGEVTNAVKKFSGVTGGGGIVYQNVDDLWIPPPIRKFSLYDENETDQTTIAQSVAANQKVVEELDGEGIHNVSTAYIAPFDDIEKPARLDFAKAKKAMNRYPKDNRICNFTWQEGYASKRGKALIVPTMRLPFNDSIDQHNNFFSSMNNVASLKMASNTANNNTNAYILNAENRVFLVQWRKSGMIHRKQHKTS